MQINNDKQQIKAYLQGVKEGTINESYQAWLKKVHPRKYQEFLALKEGHGCVS